MRPNTPFSRTVCLNQALLQAGLVLSLTLSLQSKVMSTPPNKAGSTIQQNLPEENSLLLEDIDDILNILRAEKLTPRNPSPPQQSQLLKDILAPLSGQGKILTEAEIRHSRKQPASPIGRSLKINPAVHYIELLDISDTAHAKLKQSLSKLGDDQRLVLDLRQTRTGALSNVPDLADSLGGTPPPIAILIGPQTAGSAECLVQELSRKHQAVTLGTPSKGYPYGRKIIPLKSGLVLELPKTTPEATSDIPYSVTPLTPDIHITSPFEINQPPHKDPSVRKAADLVTAVRAFSNPHF